MSEDSAANDCGLALRQEILRQAGSLDVTAARIDEAIHLVALPSKPICMHARQQRSLKHFISSLAQIAFASRHVPHIYQQLGVPSKRAGSMAAYVRSTSASYLALALAASVWSASAAGVVDVRQ